MIGAGDQLLKDADGYGLKLVERIMSGQEPFQEAGDIKKHKLYTKSDYDHLKKKGYDDKEILAIWDKDAKRGHQKGLKRKKFGKTIFSKFPQESESRPAPRALIAKAAKAINEAKESKEVAHFRKYIDHINSLKVLKDSDFEGDGDDAAVKDGLPENLVSKKLLVAAKKTAKDLQILVDAAAAYGPAKARLEKQARLHKDIGGLKKYGYNETANVNRGLALYNLYDGIWHGSLDNLMD